MGSNAAQIPTVTNRQESSPTVVGSPIQRSFRGVIRDSYEEGGARLVAAVLSDIDSTGLTDDEVCERLSLEKAQLSRIRHGQAHLPGRLVMFAIDVSRHRPPLCVSAACAMAEGEFLPKPPPSVEERHEATVAVLHEMGIDEVVRAKVARRLGVTP